MAPFRWFSSIESVPVLSSMNISLAGELFTDILFFGYHIINGSVERARVLNKYFAIHATFGVDDIYILEEAVVSCWTNL